MSEGVLHLSAGIFYLIGQIGSPFAMTYGGHQLGTSGAEFAQWTQAMASVLDAVSASAGLAASFERRAQEWQHQLLLAQQELRQVEQQRLAAEIRAAITAKELALHQTAIDQAAELDEFYHNKFSNLGLYNYLATTLTRLHREAYNVASDLARMAERAYHFERPDDSVFLGTDNWQFDKAGLLAGERLSIQLQQLENAYLTKNTRQFEITQSFSLAMLDPRALVSLREAGYCEFTVPEIFFDLAFPGQYRRIIKSVRLTIPCVAGPYTGVSAKLTLKESKVRADPIASADLVKLPPPTTPSIATSTAVSDAGVFELSYRDERYLPFEGGGAVSTWVLELPSQLRAFDYDSIADVIVHISYCSLDDEVLRTTVETALVGNLAAYASTDGMYRLLSLRHDFPNAWYKLLHPTGAAQETEFTLAQQHFPYFLSGRALSVVSASVYIQPKGSDPVDTTGLTISINGTGTTSWTTLAKTTLRTADVPVAGLALRSWSVEVTGGRLEPSVANDVLILLKYKVTL
jgi:hypothetical protein